MLLREGQELELIKILRFPLIVMVVMIHAEFSTISMGGENFQFNLETFPIYSNLSFLISQLISHIAVPIFYIFSGYLFFYNLQAFTTKEYIRKIRSRAQTLLIPYVFWNFAVILLFFMLQTFIPSMASGENKLIVDYTITDWIKAFWSYKLGMPICYQLWFIRDLMVVILLSPIIYYAIKKTNIYCVLALGILWAFNINIGVPGFKTVAFFFFALGAIFSIKPYNLNVIKKIKNLSYLLSILLLTFEIIMYNMDNAYNLPNGIVDVIYNTCIFSMIISLFNITLSILQKRQIEPNRLLYNSNFFIYAYHAMPLTLFTKVLIKCIEPTTEIQTIFIYVAAPMLTIAVGVLIFNVLKKILPQFTSLITGGRL